MAPHYPSWRDRPAPYALTAEGEQAALAGFGLINWGDGYGLEPDNEFALNCNLGIDTDDLRSKPVRPVRRPPLPTFARAAEPEAGQ